MIKVQFNSEVNGVREVNCHHVTREGGRMLLHFTKAVAWEVEFWQIEQIG